MRLSILAVLSLVILSTLVVKEGVASVYMPPGQAAIQNYQGYWDGYLNMPPYYYPSGVANGFYPGMLGTASRSTTPSITVSVVNSDFEQPPSSNPTSNSLLFSTDGLLPPGVSSAYYCADYRVGGQYYYRVIFDWMTYWESIPSSVNVRLEMFGEVGPCWSVNVQPGYNFGHVDLTLPWEQHVYGPVFALSVETPVPEPRGLTVLLVSVGVIFDMAPFSVPVCM